MNADRWFARPGTGLVIRAEPERRFFGTPGYAMKLGRKELSRRYVAGLRRHLAKGPRARAKSAETLGRQALSAGLGTLDLARIHEQALSALLRPKSSTESSNGRVPHATGFFVDALAPIEKTR